MEKVEPTKKLVYSNVDGVDWEGPMVEVLMQVPDSIFDIEEKIIDELMEDFYKGYQEKIKEKKPEILKLMKENEKQ